MRVGVLGRISTVDKRLVEGQHGMLGDETPLGAACDNVSSPAKYQTPIARTQEEDVAGRCRQAQQGQAHEPSPRFDQCEGVDRAVRPQH